MADSLKRITWAKSAQNQDKIDFYLFQKALSVMAETTPDETQLAFAKKIYAGEHNLLACSKVVASNATIGASIDAGSAPAETDIEYVVVTAQWANLAMASGA